MAYSSGDVRETEVTHEVDGDNLVVNVGAATGSYAGASDERNVEIRLFSPERVVGQVLLNGEELPAVTGGDEQGWLVDEAGTIVVKSGTLPVDTALNFVFEPAATTAERPLLARPLHAVVSNAGCRVAIGAGIGRWIILTPTRWMRMDVNRLPRSICR